MPENHPPRFPWWTVVPIAIAAAGVVIELGWPKWIAVALVLLSVGWALLAILQYRHELAAYRARPPAGPRIRVRPDGRYLVVKSEGCDANFYADIRVVARRGFSSASTGEVYKGCWEPNGSTEGKIADGQEGRLWLGQEYPYPRGNDGPLRVLRLYHHTRGLDGVDDTSSPPYLEATDPYQLPWLRVEVSITSSPRMAEEWVQFFNLTSWGGISKAS
jgi:hypothetical protein